MRKEENLYAVMGYPVEHSKSPQIHSLFAKQTGENVQYEKIAVKPEEFDQAIAAFRARGGLGLNITVPLKQLAFDWVQEKTERAAKAGAVNTIKFLEQGTVLGDNTDGIGLVNDLKNNHVELNDKIVLLIGAGGAARGVILPLLHENPKLLHIANRTTEKAIDLKNRFNKNTVITASGFSDVNNAFDIIINATSSSLHNTVPEISSAIFKEESIAYDLFYATQVTAFQNWARECNVEKALDGFGMLVEQAAESFYVWRGVRPETAPVIDEVRSSLRA